MIGQTRPVDDGRDLVDSTRAWQVALAAGLANGVAFGTAYTFGAFFEAMAEEFGAGRGSTALIFGLTLLLFFGFGVVSGPLSDRYSPRLLLIVGGVLFCGGLVATSQVTQVWLGYLTYGVGVGLGAGFWVTPTYAAVGALFQRHRAVALGVTATGNGLGTLILVPVAERLIDAYGWRDAYLWLAGIGAVAIAIAAAVIVTPPRTPAPPARELRSRLIRTSNFKVLFGSGMLMSVGLFVAFAFIVPFARDNGVSSEAAARLVGLVGLASIVGRLGTTGLTSRLGPVRLFQLTLALQPVAYVVWLVAGSNMALLVVFVLLLGVSYGGFVALSPEVAVHLFGVGGIGSIIGLLFLSTGLGGLVGPPAAGWLSDQSDGGQTVPIVAVIATLLVALVLVARLRDEQQLDTGPVARAAVLSPGPGGSGAAPCAPSAASWPGSDARPHPGRADSAGGLDGS
jgi:predicted MFS family arabinose efflux permease